MEKLDPTLFNYLIHTFSVAVMDISMFSCHPYFVAVLILCLSMIHRLLQWFLVTHTVEFEIFTLCAVALLLHSHGLAKRLRIVL